MKKLPKKPSALIRLALKDLELCQKSADYKIDMNTFHSPTYTPDNDCAVCFAGAVMAQSLRAPQSSCLSPSSYPTGTRHKLYALDLFRRGHIMDGLSVFGINTIKSRAIPAQHVPAWRGTGAAFKKAMRNLASILKRKGL